MSKRIIAILILVICLGIALILFIVAHVETNRADEMKELKIKVIVEWYGDYQIIYDKYTKVMYSVSDGGYNEGVLTLLVDADGKPLLYTEEGDEE